MSDDLMTKVKRTAAALGVLAVFCLIVTVSAWNMVFHYVEPDELLVVISKSGDDIPADRIIAKPGEKGPQLETLGPGRHFIWPVIYKTKIFKLKSKNMIIPPLQIGVVTSSTLSPMLGAQPVAFGIIKTAQAMKGTTVLVEAEGELAEAVLCELRFLPSSSESTSKPSEEA